MFEERLREEKISAESELPRDCSTARAENCLLGLGSLLHARPHLNVNDVNQ